MMMQEALQFGFAQQTFFVTQAGGCADNACGVARAARESEVTAPSAPLSSLGDVPMSGSLRSACAGKTGKEYMVKVRDDEGLASHIEPEPCVGIREGDRRSVGRETYRLSIELRKVASPERRRYAENRKATRSLASSRVSERLCAADDLCMYRNSLRGNREVFGSAAITVAVRIGKAMSRSR